MKPASLWSLLIVACSIVVALQTPLGQLPPDVIHLPTQLDTKQVDAATLGRPNLIDLLASSPDHTILLRLLQRTRLIPTLNRLQEFDDGSGMTILAPTDDAILRRRDQERKMRFKDPLFSTPALTSYAGGEVPLSLWEHALALNPSELHGQDVADLFPSLQPVWKSQGVVEMDNVNAMLRQHLLYHVLNYTLPYSTSNETGIHKPSSPIPEVGRPIMHETMHFPSRRLLQEPTRPGHIPKPDKEDHGGLLGNEGQKLRVGSITETKQITKFKKESTPALTFGTASDGSGGVRCTSELWSSPNGVIFSIDGILDLPPSLDTVINTHKSLKTLRSLLPPTLLKTLSTTPHLSLFLPASDAFDSLTELEWRFLSGKWKQSFNDRMRLVGWHASGLGVGDGRTVYGARLRDSDTASITTILGGTLSVNRDKNDHLLVNGARVIEEDILTENGVVHLIDGLILPEGDLGMTVEKYLLALNATKFVSLMYEAGLESYINQPPHGREGDGDAPPPFTFLAPRDDVIDAWLARRKAELLEGSLPSSGFDAAPSLSEVLKYHILPGQNLPKDLSDGMLIGTELIDWKLKEGRQRIPVEVDEEQASGDRKGNGDVGFGDANVLAEPVNVGGSTIYIISQLLDPPANPIQTAVSFLTLSTFVATVFSAELKKAIQRAPGVTYLVPTNDAFTGLGLTMNYLLLPESQPELQAVIEYHAIDRIVYAQDFSQEVTSYPTLLPDGGRLYARKTKNGTVLISRTQDFDENAARIIKRDILTNTGVMHEVNLVEVPIEISNRKLIRGAKAETMEDLIIQAGYGFTLDGIRNASEGEQSSFVILTPTDAAFTRINLTHILEDPAALDELVRLHIIPCRADDLIPAGKGSSLGIKDEATFASLLDKGAGGSSQYGQISFRKIPDSEEGIGWMVGIKGTRGTDGRGHAAKVLGFGRESKNASSSQGLLATYPLGGVISIDTVLTPYRPGWFYRWGWIIFTVVLTLAGISAVGFYGYRFWNRDGRIKLPEALEGEEE
ncbi:FAS1 domain-containing protein [Violaceomyces palustris]|uniref:FAS1 domain-containing protein n=1 Tax=Violaceomyces palustris TaxID=1673888 RepID=A0ACD0NX11_9BASI|nr:FAS1 domain-containing protein [Violaceomyces palustris]